jgi:hypothetical protein
MDRTEQIGQVNPDTWPPVAASELPNIPRAKNPAFPMEWHRALFFGWTSSQAILLRVLIHKCGPIVITREEYEWASMQQVTRADSLGARASEDGDSLTFASTPTPERRRPRLCVLREAFRGGGE